MKTFDKDLYRLPSGKTIEFEFYGHASLSIAYDGVVMYIDPVSTEADYTQLPKADIILVTHEHNDHFDKNAIENISSHNTILITNTDKIVLNTDKIITDTNKIVLNTHETFKDKNKDITITAFAAHNTTAGRDKFHPTNRDNGYLITIEDFSIYVSGDTEMVEDDARIKNCDILFLAVNQPYTMTIEQAEHFASIINPKIFYPYHTTDTDMDKLKETFAKYDFKTIIHPMQ